MSDAELDTKVRELATYGAPFVDAARLSDPVAGAAYRFQPDLEQLASGNGPLSRKVQVIRSGNRRHRFSFGKVGREIGEDEAGHGPARLDRSARPIQIS